MKRLLASFILIASPALAQIGPVPAGGAGAIGSGTALTACTSSILYADASSLLKCNPASVVNGSVSTAGRSILTIQDTISGSSATSNFLNVTGTFANSASAAMYGLYFHLTAPSTTGAFPINGIRLSLDYNGAFSETQTAGIVVTNVATNSGGASPFALAVTTEPTSVGIYGSGPYVGAGVYGAVVGGSTGARGAGVIGKVIGNANTANGFGGIFTAQGSTGAGENIGLAAVLAGATSDTQGLATLPATDVALLADNGSVAANIFEARDNGTAVFTIADGGVTTILGTAPMLTVGTGTTTQAGLQIGYSGTSSYGGIWATSISPTVNNYSFMANTTTTYVGATTTVNIGLNNSPKLQVGSTGFVNLPPLALTAATMTPTIVAEARTVTNSYAWTNAMVTALGASLTGDITAVTLPAKTQINNAYVVIDTAAGGVTTLTVSCGDAIGGTPFINYIVASDAKAAANTVYGDAVAERGTSIDTEFFYLPSYTSTTLVTCHFISTGTNLNTVTTSTGRLILTTTLLP